MLFTNNLYSLQTNIENVRSKLDAHPDIKADVVPMSGEYIKEQKMWHILQFCKANTQNEDVLRTCSEPNRPFNPQILMATSSSTNCGIDSPDVDGVFRTEIAKSVRDAFQESGRAGRWLLSERDGVWYCFCYSLESLCSLLRRTFRSFMDKENKMTKTFYLHLIKDIYDVLGTFVLPQRCIHASMALTLCNPFVGNSPSFGLSCITKCSFCRGEFKKLYPKINRAGTTQVLMDIFCHKRHLNPLLTIDDTLVSAIKKYRSDHDDSSRKLIFGSAGAAGNLRPIDIKKTILILIAAKVIDFSLVWATAESEDSTTTNNNNNNSIGATPNTSDKEKEKKRKVSIVASLGPDTNGLMLHSDVAWSLLPTK
jgi:hypothetical protein